jgi:hypothetical protein
MPRTFANTCFLLVTLFSLHGPSSALANESPPEPTSPAATTADEAPQAPATSPRVTRRNRQNTRNEAEIKELLALIPDSHPMREELRQIVLVGPPAGFSARQWLELSMKVDFRTTVTKGGNSQSDQYDF